MKNLKFCNFTEIIRKSEIIEIGGLKFDLFIRERPIIERKKQKIASVNFLTATALQNWLIFQNIFYKNWFDSQNTDTGNE